MLTREYILSLEAGREMDALVEQHVFGKQVEWWNDEVTDPYPIVPAEYGYIVDHYSTDNSAAWDVVENLRESHLYVDIRTCADFYEAFITDWSQGSESPQITETAASPNIAHAICMVALLTTIQGESNNA